MFKSLSSILFFVIAIGVYYYVSANHSLKEELVSAQKIRITKIVDGDTFWAADESLVNKKYRLIGIDAPEIANHAKKKKDPFAAVSTKALQEYLKDSIAFIQFDKDSFDRYKRYLVYAYNQQNQFINYEMIRNGFATVMSIRPNTSYQSIFEKAQDSAQLEQKGLWKWSVVIP